MSEIKYQFEYIDVIESTHEYVIKQQQGSMPKVVIAGQQTNGIGQFGRKWSSQPNSSLLMSISFSEAPVSNLHFIPFLMGMSCHEAINSSLISLKWPNDLYLEERKLGGILCESKFSGNKISKVVMSCGINLKPTSNTLGGIAYLNETGNNQTAVELGEQIIERLLWNYAYSTDQNILDYYNTYLFGKQNFYTYENPQKSINARVVALQENGNLELVEPNGKSVIFNSPGTYKLSI